MLRGLMVILLSVMSLILGKAHAFYRGQYDLTSSTQIIGIIGLIFLTVFFAYSFGLPEKPSLRTHFRTALIASIAPVIVLALVQTVIGGFLVPRLVLALSVPVNTMVLVVLSRVSRSAEQSGRQTDVACLLVSHDLAARIVQDASGDIEIPVEVALIISPNEPLSPLDFSTRCVTSGISVVVVSENAVGQNDVTECLQEVHSLGVKIRTVSGFYDSYVGKFPVNVGELSLPPDDPDSHRVFYSRISRLLDIAVAVIGLGGLLLMLPFVVVGNAVGNRGPLFYSQERVGKQGRIFRMHKFRSMEPGGVGSQWTSESDSRVTRFGRVMRLTHIDEFPQFWNILNGDLSLIGPRPEQPAYVAQLTQSIPRYEERHITKPGLTGWAQVNYPYGASEEDSFEKLQYDLWYVRHQRLWVDVKIMARTFRHIVGMGGR
jgi:lipopolysaccharide/colanic/teichoic acid biosynthesis glycosyltransferase